MKLLVVLWCVLFSANAFPQVALLDKCYDLILQKDFQKAETAILLAEKNVVTANDSRTHYLKSFIYKELFVQSVESRNKTTLRNKAISSIKRCAQLDHDNTFRQPLKQLRDYVLASVYNDGTDNYNNRKYSEAIGCFKQFIDLMEQKDSHWLDANYFVGSSYYSLNKIDSAEYFLELVKEKNYDEPILFVDLSYLYLNKNDKKAIATINEGLSKYPNHFDLQIAELNALSRFQMYDTLKGKVEMFLKLYPDNIEALLLAGTTYEKLRNDETHTKYFIKAENVYKKIIDIDSIHYDANYNLGVLYYNEAVDIVNKSNLETNIEELNKILEKSTQFFERSLPLIIKIYKTILDQKKNDLKLLKALQAIYYNLNMKNELSDINELIKSFK